MKKFIFDVDGTLTDSRQQIDLSFEVDMIKFCCKNDVYLVTGSDRQKTIDQLGLDICYRAKRVYNCSGSDVYVRDKNIYTSEWKPYGSLINFLSDELDYSKEYVKWDINTTERILMVDRIKSEFPDLNIQIGGQTGLDISDNDKSQILRDFNPEDEIHFYGDMMEEGQNDYPLAKALKEMGGYPHHVKNWEDTRTLLSKV